MTQAIYRAEFLTRTLVGHERTVRMIVSREAAPDDWSRVAVTIFDINDRSVPRNRLSQ
jgi:hypothetical protein